MKFYEDERPSPEGFTEKVVEALAASDNRRRRRVTDQHLRKRYRVIKSGSKKMLFHRYVMEQFLGRPLHEWEVIHHINENPLDNRIENLMVTTLSRHAQIHHPKFRPDYVPCAGGCGKQVKFRSRSARTTQFCAVCAGAKRRTVSLDSVRAILRRVNDGEKLFAVCDSVNVLWQSYYAARRRYIKSGDIHKDETRNVIKVLSDADVVKIRELFKAGVSRKDIAKGYSVAYGNICMVIRGETFKYLTDLHHA